APALYAADEETDEGSASNYTRTETQVKITGNEYANGHLNVVPDPRPEQYGFVNLQAPNNSKHYLVTQNNQTAPTFNRTTSLTADANYPGTFRLVYVGSGKDDAVTTGISEITVDGDASDVWFDLQGRRVVNPTHGLFINAKGKKVFINK
ncbi:MAG: hypothetical protein K2M97_07755, partial [Muribaculaceae bacterium]|nr:hypothetical protein [Muribaculaceae bacterium]